MKTKIISKFLILLGFALTTAFSGPHFAWAQGVSAQTSVYLVLGPDATLNGYTASDNNVIFHENVVVYTASPGSALPTPVKPGTTFVSWVYSEDSSLVRTAVMPAVSDQILFAYYHGDGTLATGSSAVSSSSSQSSASSSDSIALNITIYFKNTAAGWTGNTPYIYIYISSPFSEPAGPWHGSLMSAGANGWYSYVLTGYATAKVIFYVSTTVRDPADNVAGFDVYEGNNYYLNGVMSTTNPG
jgi:hypothetical protein